MQIRIVSGFLLLSALCVIVNGSYFNADGLQKARRICNMKNCDHYSIHHNTHDEFFEMKNSWHSQSNYLAKFHIYVQAKADFRILLTVTNTPLSVEDFSYEFVIGDRNNSHVYIRREQNMLKMTENITPNLLDAEVPLRVDLEITKGGEIKLFIENKPVTGTADPEPMPVKYVSFAVGGDNTADVYDCDQMLRRPTSMYVLSSAERSHAGLMSVLVILLAVLWSRFDIR